MIRPPVWSLPPIQRVNLPNFKRTIEQVDPTFRVLIPEIFTFYKLSDILDDLP